MAESQAFKDGLASKDPRVRYRTIKEIARAKDADMLLPLLNLAEYDPNEKVRELADRAAHHIGGQSQNGESQAPKAFVQKQLVSEKDKEKARYHMDVAIDYSIKGEREKALKELSKALKLNPQLEADGFFHSVRDEVTGLSGDESMALLRDKDQLQQFGQEEVRRNVRQEMDAHQEDVDRSTWTSALMDLGIYAFILFFATLFLPVAVNQAANGFVASQQAAWVAYEEDVAAGKGNATPPDAVDPAFEETVMAAQSLGLNTGFILAAIVSISGVVGLIINLGLIHGVARMLFKGQATFRYLIYKVVSFYNARLPILFGLIYLGVVATFILGGGVIPLVFGGLAGLFSLLVSFKLVGRVGEAYHFGFLKAFLSMGIAGFVLAILGAIVQLLAFSALTTMLMNTMV